MLLDLPYRHCKQSAIIAIASVTGCPLQSELAFRMLCFKYGATAAYTPMLHSRLFLEDPKYRAEHFTTCPGDRCISQAHTTHRMMFLESRLSAHWSLPHQHISDAADLAVIVCLYGCYSWYSCRCGPPVCLALSGHGCQALHSLQASLCAVLCKQARHSTGGGTAGTGPLRCCGHQSRLPSANCKEGEVWSLLDGADGAH